MAGYSFIFKCQKKRTYKIFFKWVSKTDRTQHNPFTGTKTLSFCNNCLSFFMTCYISFTVFHHKNPETTYYTALLLYYTIIWYFFHLNIFSPFFFSHYNLKLFSPHTTVQNCTFSSHTITILPNTMTIYFHHTIQYDTILNTTYQSCHRVHKVQHNIGRVTQWLDSCTLQST